MILQEPLATSLRGVFDPERGALVADERAQEQLVDLLRRESRDVVLDDHDAAPFRLLGAHSRTFRLWWLARRSSIRMRSSRTSSTLIAFAPCTENTVMSTWWETIASRIFW